MSRSKLEAKEPDSFGYGPQSYIEALPPGYVWTVRGLSRFGKANGKAQLRQLTPVALRGLKAPAAAFASDNAR
jgi:hypothetical protein